MVEYGALSIVPPLLAIGLAIVTRRPILSLFLGIWSGGIIQTGGLGLGQTFQWIAESFGNDVFHAQIIIFTLLLGAAVALMWRIGGSVAVHNYVARRFDSQREVGATAWLLGILLFFDDYANTAIVGSTMRDISDELRISREKLSYIVDSTAAPVATLGISSWVAFQVSLIEDGYQAAGIADQAPPGFIAFVQSIPFNMYSILAILMVGLIVLSGRDYGEMLDAERRSWQTGNVIREEATPMQAVGEELGEPNTERPLLRSFFGPILVLIAVTVASAFWTGYQAADVTIPTLGQIIGSPESAVATLATITGESDWAVALVWGSFSMVATAIIIGLVYGLINLEEGVDSILDGFRLMLTAVTILVLAWSISAVAEALGTGTYVAGIAQQFITPELLPFVIVIAAAFIAFSMGSSWATMGILTPIAVPVAWELTASMDAIPVVIGAIFSGAIFGDHASPISDTTVLSATFTGADLIDHVRTQLYYAGTVMGVAALLFLIYGYTNISPFILLPIGVVLLVILVYGFSEFAAKRRGVPPRTADIPQESDD